MSEARITVDTDSGIAPWRQIHDQLELLVSGGALEPGTALLTSVMVPRGRMR